MRKYQPSAVWRREPSLITLEKIVAIDPRFDILYLRPAPDRLAQIAAAFKKTDGAALGPVRELLGDNYSFDELRLARMFLK